ncbi:hypothetical protein CI1B_68980 [Bradyrhizobium ivorense]|uniref:Uncharacterized protein n=1 Tax=Bradyrhizobium ivorense TaxID=2511166 RepID=A0A508TR72_9BRAD|nr:hypothetical protein [Bradyrhizobium ivorense]VIO77075.1 hypothetical protein CI1B_68980 [Bradyrhizobium ivorense]
MHNFDAIAALRGDGFRPELRALLDRTATARSAELFVRADGMLQSGPNASPVVARHNVVPFRCEPSEGADDKRETTRTSTS